MILCYTGLAGGKAFYSFPFKKFNSFFETLFSLPQNLYVNRMHRSVYKKTKYLKAHKNEHTAKAPVGAKNLI